MQSDALIPTFSAAPTPPATSKLAPPVTGARAAAPTATIPDVTSATVSTTIFWPSLYFSIDCPALDVSLKFVSPFARLSSSLWLKSFPVMFLYALAKSVSPFFKASSSSFIELISAWVLFELAPIPVAFFIVFQVPEIQPLESFALLKSASISLSWFSSSSTIALWVSLSSEFARELLVFKLFKSWLLSSTPFICWYTSKAYWGFSSKLFKRFS